MTAAEFRAQGMEKELKDCNRKIEELEAELLKASLNNSGQNKQVDALNKKLMDALQKVNQKDSLVRGLEADLSKERDQKADLNRTIK
jgi:septal ring factor EnvC (AmiA/AmiB activator)